MKLMEKRNHLRKYIWSFLLIGAVALGIVDFGAPAAGNRVQASYGRTLSKRCPDAVDEELKDWIDQAGSVLNELAGERDIMALVYLSDRYPIRLQPSYDGAAAVTVYSGQTVDILDVYVDDDFLIWCYVTLNYGGEEYYGYIPRANLAVSDLRFLNWEEEWNLRPSGMMFYSVSGGDAAVSNADIEMFPESYRPALYALREKHPSWQFVKLNTGLDWNYVVSEEMKNGKSLVWYEFPDWAKDELYDSHNWYYATEPALKMYLDPRNALTEDAVFQFEQLTYNKEYHKKEALKSFLNNTFMNDSQPAPGTVMTFEHIFWALAVEDVRQVSPFHLAARVLQEQGLGKSPLISGTYPGYENYYNYFNIHASGTSNEEIIRNGLSYARDHGWDNAYMSIMGGADFISKDYIKQGQDTLYLQKYNVKPGAKHAACTHQYMQNISAPTTEAKSIRNLYREAGALEGSFVFCIPVYENMPGQPCGEPEDSLTIQMQAPEGYSKPVVYLDGVPYDAEIRDGQFILEAPDREAKTAVAYKYNESGVPVGMYVWSLTYKGKRYIVTPEPGLEDLLTAHGFSIRITGQSGIRFKTGISVNQRNALTSEGIDGYRLIEYGSIIMNNKNVGSYPMVRNGEKTSTGIAYGTDENGEMRDIVYETVDGRYRFTAVLIGLPVYRYKTEYAFRGYAVLEKDGSRVTLYGPIRARSIYALAEQMLQMNYYAPGTNEQIFLQKLIDDADTYEATVSGGDAQ